MPDYSAMPFEELAQLDSGTVLLSKEYGMFKGLILRGPCSLCAYIGVPMWHNLAGRDYDSLPDIADVHGGFTYAAPIIGIDVPKDYWWFGWDYAHWNDETFARYAPLTAGIYAKLPFSAPGPSSTKWTVPEVEAHLDSALASLCDYIVKGDTE